MSLTRTGKSTKTRKRVFQPRRPASGSRKESSPSKDRAQEAATQILDAFREGRLPAALELIFLRRRNADVPCSR